MMGSTLVPELLVNGGTVIDEVITPLSMGFEGYEKRLEVEFHPAAIFTDPAGRGLRALSRADLDCLLNAAKCTIVSYLSNDDYDSYVLSESSLFVSPTKLVLKTCGTTELLSSIPLLLAFAEDLSMKLRRVKYTRGTFMFPGAQPHPHGSFSDEVNFLEQYFGKLGSGGKAYVMGQSSNWHLYTASDETLFTTPTVYTLEMCMTKLDVKKTTHFFNETGEKLGVDMTMATGIGGLLPGYKVCDYAFAPCGYSMNSICGTAHSTIHVSPEEASSFASFETMGYGPEDVDLGELLGKVTSIFKPGTFSICLHATGVVADGGGGGSGGWNGVSCPRGYVCDGTSRQVLPGGSVATFHTFKDLLTTAPPVAPVRPLPLLESADDHQSGFKAQDHFVLERKFQTEYSCKPRHHHSRENAPFSSVEV